MRLFNLLILLTTITVNAQSNFSIIDNQIKWQKVYEMPISKEELKTRVKLKSKFENLYKTFSSRVGPFKIECEGSMPIYMRNQFTYYVLIEHKKNKYRITINNIKLIPSNTIELYGTRNTENAESFSDYVVRNNGTMRSNKLSKRVLKCLDQKFQNDFKFTSSNTNW